MTAMISLEPPPTADPTRPLDAALAALAARLADPQGAPLPCAVVVRVFVACCEAQGAPTHGQPLPARFVRWFAENRDLCGEWGIVIGVGGPWELNTLALREQLIQYPGLSRIFLKSLLAAWGTPCSRQAA